MSDVLAVIREARRARRTGRGDVLKCGAVALGADAPDGKQVAAAALLATMSHNTLFNVPPL